MTWKLIMENKVLGMVKDAGMNFVDDKALRLSAALSYYSVFSIAPLLVIAISVAGLVLGKDAVSGELGNQLSSFVGATAAEAIQSLVKSASKPSDSVMGAIIGFFTLLIGASGVFAQLKDALNTVWEVEPKSGGGIGGFVRERILSFGMVLVIGFLLLTSLLLSTTIAALTKILGSALPIHPVISTAVTSLVSIGIVTLLFGFIFKVLPDAKVKWSNVWVGAGITSVLFEIGKFGLGIYLGRASTTSSFGAAGSLVLLLIWVYYASCILFFGAEFTQVYAKYTGHVIQPTKNAVAIGTSNKGAQA